MSNGQARDPEHAIVVTALATTPVKGLRVSARSQLMLTRNGADDNRRFYLIDEHAQMVNGKKIGILSAVRAEYDPDTARLTMLFPDGTEATDTVRLAAPIQTRFFARRPTAHLVLGPWSELLTSYTGSRLRLVQCDPGEGGVDRGPAGAVSLLSRASVAALEARAGRAVDPRRFRMLIEVDGPSAHHEDGWVGQTLQIGDARVAFRGHVGRCLVTARCPERGIVDLPTLELLTYRLGLETTERLAFGVFGEVLEPGLVRIGDAVTPDPDRRATPLRERASGTRA